MKRYLNSFFLTALIYLVAGIAFYFAFDRLIVVKEKKEETVTKISLNSVSFKAVEEAVQETPIQEKPPEPIEEEVIEKPIEKIVEKPTPKPKPIEKKVLPKEKPKPLEKTIQKKAPQEIEQKTEAIAPISELNQTSQENQAIKKEASPTLNQTQINNIENAYLSKVRAKIEQNKVYPKVSKRLNQTGKVHISFDILKNGKIENIRVLEKSKFEKLDQASVEVLVKIVSFDAIPNELNKSVWNISIPINYQIN